MNNQPIDPSGTVVMNGETVYSRTTSGPTINKVYSTKMPLIVNGVTVYTP